MKTYPSDEGNAAFVSLARGEDLLEGLGAAVAELGIEAGTLQVIGGLEEAAIGYFDKDTAEYVTTRTGHVEMSGLGNVSLRDGEPFIHLHLTVSGRDGAAMGGHAMAGCRAYVVEAYFRRLGGPPPVRQEVEGIHLKVWPGA
ncbi:MAG TPA: PPC domain-containing DNA-binding protein [Actinomycetota bacterium]|nr:PPC domain-containing DNA-binding protein [Actinomycetota bacterium]